MEHLQAPADRCGVVVVAALVASGDPLDHDLVGRFDEHGGSQPATFDEQHFGKRVGLGQGAREPVEQEARALADAFLDHRDDQAVGHQVPVSHVRRGLAAQLRALRSMLTEEVAGGDVGETELVAQLRGLRALAHTGRSNEHKPEFGFLRG